MITTDDLLKQAGKKNPDAASNRRVDALARRMGMTLKLDEDGKIAWTGKFLNTALSVTNTNVLHDVAHFQLATPIRRRMPDFGLGPSVDSQGWAPRVIPSNQSDIEENIVSILGILWERELGINHIDTLHDHNWIDRDGKLFSGRIDLILPWLAKQGYIDANGVPQMKLRRVEPLFKLPLSYK